MSVSYEPESYDFGELTAEATATQTISVTNDGEESVIISGPSGTLSVTTPALPYTLTAGETCSFTVAFAPTASGSYSGALISDSEDDTGCALGGSCSAAVTTSADDDGYEQSTITGTGKTYLRLEVQDFNGDGNGTVTVNGYELTGLDSFLHLGARADDNSGERGYELSQLVTAFVDDDRVRKLDSLSDNPYYRLSQDERATETGVLHSRGGWRDHTDGNRISTTRGDKVEVIGGNYKLIVMGRRQWADATDSTNADGALHHESSGGITYHYDEVPGQFVDVRWIEDLDGVFRVKEECQKGIVIERFEGRVKEWYYGRTIETRVGDVDLYDLAKDTVTEPTLYDEDTDAGYAVDTDLDKDASEDHSASVDWPPTDEYQDSYTAAEEDSSYTDSTDFKGYIPDIVETTWANSTTEREWAYYMTDIKGSAEHRIPEIKEYDYAEKVEEKLSADTVIETVDIRPLPGVSNPAFVESIDATGASIVEKVSAEYTGYYDGDCAEYWGLGLEGGVPFTNFGEVYLGGFESLRMGSSLTTFTGAKADLHVLQPVNASVELLAATITVLSLTFHFELLFGTYVEVHALSENLGDMKNHFALTHSRAALNSLMT